MIGILFTMLSAASFGLNTASVRRGVVRGSALQGVYVTVFAGVPMFLLAALVTGQLVRWDGISQSGYILLAIAGVLHFLWGRYCGYRAMGILGANRATSVEALAILIAVLLGVFVLQETLSLPNVAGIALIIIGPAIMIHYSMRRSAREAPSVEGGTGRGPNPAPVAGPAAVSTAVAPAPAEARRYRTSRRRGWWRGISGRCSTRSPSGPVPFSSARL
jgi:uncharacterized membrane protein